MEIEDKLIKGMQEQPNTTNGFLTSAYMGCLAIIIINMRFNDALGKLVAPGGKE